MSEKNKIKLSNIPGFRYVVGFLKAIKLNWLKGLSLYELLALYLVGLANGALTHRAAAIAFSFFMALFPFALFILNLLPYIPIEGFKTDFLHFIETSLPPKTYDAVAAILNDIITNSHSGLLSWGFLLSIFLMANGLNAILGGFETSQYVLVKRGFIRQYAVALGMSILLSFILLFTVAIIVVFEVMIQNSFIQNVLPERIAPIVWGRYVFLALMILLTTSILLKFGTKHSHKRALISIGSVFTTILFILTSYGFGIWVVKFSSYNELYGSIGTLLIMMLYIWLNCVILLLGFELNLAIDQLKRKNQTAHIS